MRSTRSCEPAMNSGKSSTKYLTASLDTLKADKRFYVGDTHIITGELSSTHCSISQIDFVFFLQTMARNHLLSVIQQVVRLDSLSDLKLMIGIVVR